MATVKQYAKSKTVQTNTLYLPAIVGILELCGVAVPLPVVLLGYALINGILRRITKKPLEEK